MWLSRRRAGHRCSGRDLLAPYPWRAFAFRPSPSRAAIATCTVGLALGLIAGYYGGWADRIVSRIVDIWMAFPPALLHAILLVAVLGTGLGSVIAAIAVIDWTRFCRVVRAEAMSWARMDYVEGRPHRRGLPGRFAIMLREVLPNVLPSIIALLSLEMVIGGGIVEAILSVASISTDDPTWAASLPRAIADPPAWWCWCLAIDAVFTVLSFSQFGEG